MASKSGTAVALGFPREAAPGKKASGSALAYIVVLSVAGLALFWWQFLALWRLWTTDSLRSIGILVIPTSAILAARALRREDFREGGSWWGLALVASALSGAILHYYGSFTLVWGRLSGLDLLSAGAIFCVYASGVLIVLGGPGACWKARVPLLLLLFVNPVPSFFTKTVDLPLQRVGAEAARSFASLLHVPVQGEMLRLMFYHGALGMFIAPGCNGLQGAVAMGMLALVIGHLRGYRLRPHALFVIGAVAVAYAFNLLRLCSLVLYYCLAYRFPVLGRHAIGADYVIGGTLFVLAAAFLLLPRGRSIARES